MLKTMVPYLPLSQQKQIAVMITLLELKNTLSVLSTEKNAMTMCEIPEGTDKKSAMLSAVRKFCSPKEQETIDMLMNMLSVMENYDLFFNNSSI